MEYYEDLHSLAVQHGVKGKKLNKVHPAGYFLKPFLTVLTISKTVVRTGVIATHHGKFIVNVLQQLSIVF